MQENLKAVDFETLKVGEIVLIEGIPSDWLSSDPNLNGRIGKVRELQHNRVLLNVDGYGFPIISRSFLYYPPEPSESKDVPVLIDLEKAMEWLNEVGEIDTYYAFKDEFNKPENQYHLPKGEQIGYSIHDFDDHKRYVANGKAEQKPVDEWVPAVGDEVIVNRFENKCNGYSNFNDAMDDLVGTKGVIEVIDNNPVPLAGVFHWYWPLSALTLVKKADSPGTVIPVPSDDVPATKPFDLETAKKLIEEGPISERLVLFYYPELGKKQLPMSWESIEWIEGFWINEKSQIVNAACDGGDVEDKSVYPTKQDAEAALAMSQLLQLRAEWLKISCPDWVPEYNSYRTSMIQRNYFDSLVIVKGPSYYSPLSFPSGELATKFLYTFLTLIKTAFNLPTD